MGIVEKGQNWLINFYSFGFDFYLLFYFKNLSHLFLNILRNAFKIFVEKKLFSYYDSFHFNFSYCF